MVDARGLRSAASVQTAFGGKARSGGAQRARARKMELDVRRARIESVQLCRASHARGHARERRRAEGGHGRIGSMQARCVGAVKSVVLNMADIAVLRRSAKVAVRLRGNMANERIVQCSKSALQRGRGQGKS